MVVNGLVAEELGIASGVGCASGFSQPNMAIGYALALMTDVVGGATPQTEDKAQQGWVAFTAELAVCYVIIFTKVFILYFLFFILISNIIRHVFIISPTAGELLEHMP